MKHDVNRRSAGVYSKLIVELERWGNKNNLE